MYHRRQHGQPPLVLCHVAHPSGSNYNQTEVWVVAITSISQKAGMRTVSTRNTPVGGNTYLLLEWIRGEETPWLGKSSIFFPTSTMHPFYTYLLLEWIRGEETPWLGKSSIFFPTSTMHPFSARKSAPRIASVVSYLTMTTRAGKAVSATVNVTVALPKTST